MKRKLLLGFILASLVSTNGFAAEITHGKLISHKEWTKGNITGTFKSTKAKLRASLHPISATPNDNDSSYVFVQNLVSDSTLQATVNQDINLRGYNSINIFNNSSVQKTYTITSDFVISPPCNDTLCPINEITSQDVITLDPNGGIYESVAMPTATQNFSASGQASYYISTSIQQMNGDASPMFGTYSNNGYIIVSDDSAKK